MSALEEIIMKTMRRFAAAALGWPALQYTWMRYLPVVSFPDDVFQLLKMNLCRRLQTEAIFQSQTLGPNKLFSPTSLAHVPKVYREVGMGKIGKPLTFSTKTAEKYLSDNYSDSDIGRLQGLGVRELLNMEFLYDLELLIRDSGGEFQKKSRRYHSDLAKVLIPLLSDQFCESKIRELRLIPLRSGIWVTSEDKPIFFPSDMQDWDIPQGIEARIVEFPGGVDNNVRLLYSALGVRQLNTTDIVELVVKTHKNQNPRASKLSRKTAISQMVFLFTAPARISNEAKIWVFADDNKLHLASEVYQPPQDWNCAWGYFRGEKSKQSFLHKEYLEMMKNEKDWRGVQKVSGGLERAVV
ncbi:hypothetical protein ABW19_dt0204511 [Dactylella cylindrospora]|nr:hypothetical protein ABW19_dt0204511 [Dactylella cylindrospora]